MPKLKSKQNPKVKLLQLSERGKYLKRYNTWTKKKYNTFQVSPLKENPTYHEGANDERTAILAKVRRMVKANVVFPFRDLEHWLLQRNERYRKNPGGL